MPVQAQFEILIDFDDTLVPTAYLYQLANWECGRIVQDAIAPYPMQSKEILKLADDLDNEHAKTYGFNPRRFQYSWVKAYVSIAQRLGKPVNRSVVRALSTAAAEFKKGPFNPFPGVTETLRELRDAGHRLHLLTSGDRKLQQKKLRMSDIGTAFDSIAIVLSSKKSEMLLRKLEAGAAGRRCVMVGDSKRSDIIPANEAGIMAVWLPGIQWEFARANVELNTFHTIRHFTELPGLLAALPPRST